MRRIYNSAGKAINKSNQQAETIICKANKFLGMQDNFNSAK